MARLGPRSVRKYSDEFKLTAVMPGHNPGEPPHGSATVVRQLHRSDGISWPLENDLFFHLPDIAEVADTCTGEILLTPGIRATRASTSRQPLIAAAHSMKMNPR